MPCLRFHNHKSGPLPNPLYARVLPVKTHVFPRPSPTASFLYSFVKALDRINLPTPVARPEEEGRVATGEIGVMAHTFTLAKPYSKCQSP
jgi:hypothetical protein